MRFLYVLPLLVIGTTPAIAQDVKKMETAGEQAPREVMQQFEQQSSYQNSKILHGLQFGVGVSPTSGLNGFVGYKNKDIDSFWAKRFGVRFDFATYAPIKNVTNNILNDLVGSDGYKVSENIKLQDFKIDGEHYGAIIDFYPFDDSHFLSGLRFSGGYMTGKLNLSAAPWSETVDGGLIRFYLDDWMLFYSGGQMLARAHADWKYSGPYLGTGFDLGIFHGFKMFVDAGVVFANNTPDISLNVPLDGLMRIEEITPGNKQLVFVSENDAAYAHFKEGYDTALANARKEVKDYKYYPMLKIGFMYRF